MSLQITNNSIAVSLWDYADNGICVDIVDDVYSVTTSGCFFEVEGTVVSSTLTSISNGYRMCYSPQDDFESLLGPTLFKAHGSNDNNEFIEESLYLTFGYIVEMVNSGKCWDFGFDQGVLVRVSAENLMSCPVENSEAYWFETSSMFSNELGASIVGIPEAPHGDSNLSAVIYPQSTAFFYGKVYRVIVTANDFEGNVMTPFEFEFKIKDMP